MPVFRKQFRKLETNNKSGSIKIIYLTFFRRFEKILHTIKYDRRKEITKMTVATKAVTLTLSDSQIADLTKVQDQHSGSKSKSLETLAGEALRDGIKSLVRLRIDRPSSLKEIKAKNEANVNEMRSLAEIMLASKDAAIAAKAKAILAKFSK